MSTATSRMSLIHRLPDFRWYGSKGTFTCPHCEYTSGAVEKKADDYVVRCKVGCTEGDIMAWAESQPFSRREAEQLLANVPPTGIRPGVRKQLELLRDRAEAKAIFDAEQVAANAETWAFTDFALVEDAPPVPTIGELVDGVCICRPGTVNGIHGARGGAKTWLLYLLMVREMHKGNHVLLLDFEMGGSRVRERMRRLGATDEQLQSLLHHTKPRGALSVESLDYMADRIERVGGVLTIVGIDTVGRAMNLARIDSNNADEVTRWFEAVPVPIVTAFPTAAAVLLDHIPKNADNDLFPIGSEAKAANVDTQYLVRSGRKFSKEKDGYSTVVVAKGRDGDYNEGQSLARFNGGPSGFSFTLTDSTSHDDHDGDDLSVDLSNVPDEDDLWDELNSHMPEGVLQTEFCGRGARGQYRLRLLKDLEAKGRARCAQGGRGGRGFLWFTS